EIGIDTAHEHDLGQALLALWPSYLAYVTSFITIGIIWMNHHFCVETVGRVDRPLMFINLLLLLTISFLPFPTRLVAEHLQKGGERPAVYAYATTLVLMAVIFNGWWRYASGGRRLIAEHARPARAGFEERRRDHALARAIPPPPGADRAAAAELLGHRVEHRLHLGRQAGQDVHVLQGETGCAAERIRERSRATGQLRPA